MRPRSLTTAFTLVEALISIALLALLLTAIATAMHASFQSYEENEKLAAVTQTARSVLDRMTREIRTANDIDPASTPTKVGIQPAAGGTIQRIEYEFANGNLYYRLTNTAGQTTSQVLLGSTEDVRVTSFQASYTTGQDWQGVACTKTVIVHMVLAVKNQTLTVTASGSPRKNQLY